jgi:hypothetical protein
MAGARRLVSDIGRDPEDLHHGFTFTVVRLNKVASLEIAERTEVRELLPLSESSRDLFKQKTLSHPWFSLHSRESSDIKRD